MNSNVQTSQNVKRLPSRRLRPFYDTSNNSLKFIAKKNISRQTKDFRCQFSILMIHYNYNEHDEIIIQTH